MTVRPAGFATRAVALAIDGAVVGGTTVLVGVGIWLASSIVGLHLGGNIVSALLAGVVWIVLVAAYLTAFFSLTGQTPGMRALGIRVVDLHGHIPGRARSLTRVAGMFLAAIPFGAGYMLILVDDRRRALQDRLAGTLVIHDPAPLAEALPSAVAAQH